MNIVPALLIKNEEVWIYRVLEALATVYPNIIVFDTGSTDSTIREVTKIPGIKLITSTHVGEVHPADLGRCRQFMQDEARRIFGATHIHLVDGDELYDKAYLRYIADNPMPENAMSGFTSGIECGELANGEIWFYGTDGMPTGLNRQAIIPVDSRWSGTYPFESPDCYIPGHPTNHYFPIPEGSRGFYHLHHTKRSSKEADVYLRVSKRDQFSMRDAPEIVPLSLWLNRQEDYIDE
jgi:hypothetical protein